MSLSGYVNPLSGIAGLVAERIDQGVDFSGTGPIKAVGDGQVLVTSEAGWPGGGYMAYQLTSGPASGKVIYVAEDITPTVAPGDKIKAGQTIATMFNGGSGIETGWATSNGLQPVSQTAAAGGITGANLPGGGTNPTAIGKNFDEFLQALGVASAPNAGNPTGGSLPSGYPDWLTGTQGGASAAGAGGVGAGAGGGGGFLSDVESLLGLGQATTFATDITKLISGLMWIVTPGAWVRIGAFAIAIILLIGAIIVFTRADTKLNFQPVPVPV